MASTDIQLLNEIEAKEVGKFGPFSIRDPWSLRKPLVEKYFYQTEVMSSINLRKAFLEVAKLIPPHSLDAMNMDASFNASPKGKNLGLPYFTSDRRMESAYLRRAKSIAAGGYVEDVFPCLLGWRGQPNGSTTHIKNRSVWMFDHAGTYISTGVIQPALSALRSKPGFAAWNSLSVVDRRITQIMDRAVAPIMSVDFSGYDQTLPATVIEMVYDLLRLWFKEKYAKRIDWMQRQFMTVGLVTPDGIYTGRNGGVPSGDGATNFVDSLGQLIVIRAAGLDLGFGLRDVEVLGDDGVYSFDRQVDVDQISSYYDDLYGMQVSADKGGFSLDHVLFLQRLHVRSWRKKGLCVGIRSIIRTMNGVCHLERLHRGLKPQFFTARAIMQVENAKGHPKFHQLVKYLYDHDRYLKVSDPSEIFQQAGGTDLVEEVLGLKSYKFTSELPSSGLDSFESVKILPSLRERQSQPPT
jgi:hypothetical protein